MSVNKMKAGLLIALGLITGGIGAASLAAHAQQAATTPPAVMQTATPSATGATVTPNETAEAPDTEAKEAPGAEANEPAGGHEDPAGTNVDHQFEGVE
jgi:hypothetical protein